MHRGKVHDNGGDTAFGPSPATIEVYNKSDNVRDEDGRPIALGPLAMPRQRIIVPFQNIRRDENGNIRRDRDNPATFSRGDKVTFQLEGRIVDNVAIFYATNVREEDHHFEWFNFAHEYIWRIIFVTLGSSLVLFLSGWIFNFFFLLKDSVEVLGFGPSHWINIIFSTIIFGFFTGFMIVWYWAGTRSFLGGAKSGAFTGLFLGLAYALLTLPITEIPIILNVLLVTAAFVVSFAAAGAVAGWIMSWRFAPYANSNYLFRDTDPHEFNNPSYYCDNSTEHATFTLNDIEGGHENRIINS